MKLKSVIVQALLIVFSVMLALNLNQYTERKAKNRQFKKLVANVKQELEVNNETIAAWFERQEAAELALFELIESGTLPDNLYTSFGFDSKQIAPRGLQYGTINATAWNTALQQGCVESLRAETLSKLDFTYAMQEDYVKEEMNLINDLLSSELAFSPEQQKVFLPKLYKHLREITSQEKILQRNYQSTIKIIDSLEMK